MKYYPNADQMKAADHYTMETLGVPSMELMERAAKSLVQRLEELNLSAVCIVCGSGNNGGDGFAAARLLKEKGYHVRTVFIGEDSRMTKEAAEQKRLFEAIGGEIRNTYEESEYSVIVDAVFGVGLCRKIEGRYKEVIESMNQSKGIKVAVDIASGVCASTGLILGTSFMADITVTFQREKLGMILYPGCMCCGKVMVEDIGITFPKDSQKMVYTLEEEACYRKLPRRYPDSHKGTYGKLLIIAGTKGMAGAAFLNALAAYRSGAGLVKIYTHEDNRIVLQQMIPEAVVITYEAYDEGELIKLLKWADAVLIGSGLGTSGKAGKIVRTTIENVEVPCVIDADGLNLLSEHLKYLESLTNENFIFTPHMGEMKRLKKCSAEELKEERIRLLSDFAETYGGVCVLKDSRTLVAGKEHGIYVNLTGNEALAKAGSGDVLAGIIAGFLAQGSDCFTAAVLGVRLHGLSGEVISGVKSKYSVLARDITDGLGTVLKDWEETYEKI